MTFSSRHKLITKILLLSGFLFLSYCYFESHWIKITEIEIRSPDLPGSFNGSKVVFISDIHLGPYLSSQRLSGIVARINEIKPAMIILGGDYVHYKSKYIEPVFNEFGRLRADLGVYAVLGNHDHYAGADLTRKMIAKSGINSLDNHSYWVKKGLDSIKIGGVGDLQEGIQIPENILNGLKKSDFAILVSHEPDYVENLNRELIDLTLSGHTHGGQITFFGLWAPAMPSKYGQKYRYGLIRSGKMQSYVSSGVGTVLVPFRFFSRPEIVVINLKKTEL